MNEEDEAPLLGGERRPGLVRRLLRKQPIPNNLSDEGGKGITLPKLFN